MNIPLKQIVLICMMAAILGGCNNDDFNDASKRNQNYSWWVDAKTGKAGWISNEGTNPVKDGSGIRFFFNGKVFSKFRLVDGIEVDTTTYYDMISGRAVVYQIFKDKDTTEYFIHNGPLKMYTPSGNLLSEGTIQNHNYGRIRKYYKSGKIHVIYNLKNDTGWTTNYYENGNVKDSIYDEGKATHTLKSWFENGHLAQQVEFKNHNWNGAFFNYFEDGKLYEKGIVVNGKRNGDVTTWFENGKIESIRHYEMGQSTGRQLIYYENGQVKLDAYTTNGQPDGERKMYTEDGKLKSDDIFTNGQLTEVKK